MLPKLRSRFKGTSTVIHDSITFTCQKDGCWYGVAPRNADHPGREHCVLETDVDRNHLARVMARGHDKASIQTHGYTFQLHPGTDAGVQLWMDRRLSTYRGDYWLRVRESTMEERPATSRGPSTSRSPYVPTAHTLAKAEQRGRPSQVPPLVGMDASGPARYELDSGVQSGRHELPRHDNLQTTPVYEMPARRSLAELPGRRSAAELAAGTVPPEQRVGRSSTLQRGRQPSRSPSQQSQRSVSARPNASAAGVPAIKHTFSEFKNKYRGTGRSAAVDQAAGSQGSTALGGQTDRGPAAQPRASRPHLRRYSSTQSGSGNPARSSILSFASKGSSFFTTRRPSHGQGDGPQ